MLLPCFLQTAGNANGDSKASSKAESQARLRHGSTATTFADRVFQNDMSILAASAYEVALLLHLDEAGGESILCC